MQKLCDELIAQFRNIMMTKTVPQNTELLACMPGEIELIKKYAEAKNKSLLVNSLNNYNLVAPSISSGWFIPSVGDLRAMVTNWETMNTQLGKITGSDGLKNDMYYWSSTERNNTSIFGVQLTSSGSTKVDGLKYDRPGVSSRYVFAF